MIQKQRIHKQITHSKNSRILDELPMVRHVRDLSFETDIGYRTKEPWLNIYCGRCQSGAIQNVLDDFLRDSFRLEFSHTPPFLDDLDHFIHQSPPNMHVERLSLRSCLTSIALSQESEAVKRGGYHFNSSGMIRRP